MSRLASIEKLGPRSVELLTTIFKFLQVANIHLPHSDLAFSAIRRVLAKDYVTDACLTHRQRVLSSLVVILHFHRAVCFCVCFFSFVLNVFRASIIQEFRLHIRRELNLLNACPQTLRLTVLEHLSFFLHSTMAN